jgi:hypothetical protein
MEIPQDFTKLIQSVTQDMDPGTIVIMKLFADPASTEKKLEEDSINDPLNLNPNPFKYSNNSLGGGAGGGTGSSAGAILAGNPNQ